MRASACGATTMASTARAGGEGAPSGGRPERDVGRGDEVAGSSVGERLGSAERVPREARRRAERDGATGRRPRPRNSAIHGPGQLKLARVGDRDEAHRPL